MLLSKDLFVKEHSIIFFFFGKILLTVTMIISREEPVQSKTVYQVAACVSRSLEIQLGTSVCDQSKKIPSNAWIS